MQAYIVKTAGGYLYLFANDVSLTEDPAQAGHFLSTEEASRSAAERGYYNGGFDIIPVEVEEAELNRQQKQ